MQLDKVLLGGKTMSSAIRILPVDAKYIFGFFGVGGKFYLTKVEEGPKLYPET